MSSIETMRDMKPAEYPLAEPYRIKIITADEKTKLEDYSKDVPVEKFKLEELRLMNALYPKGEPKPGDLVKVVEEHEPRRRATRRPGSRRALPATRRALLRRSG